MDQQTIWFDRLQYSLYLTPADQTAIAQYILSILEGTEEKIALPQGLQSDRHPRIVFLSASDGETAAKVVLGRGLGIEAAIFEAIAKIQVFFPEEAPQWFKVDIVQEVIALQRRNSRHPLKLDRSLYGLAFEEAAKIAFLPEELVVHRLVNREQRILPKKIIAYLEADSERLRAYHHLQQSPQFKLYRFSSTSFFCNGQKLVSLYRGHRVLNPQKIHPDLLLDAATMAGNYLTNSMQGEGTFLYKYNARGNKTSSTYNILHHAGTIYALLELYEQTQKETILDAILNGISYLLQSVHPCPDPGVGTCVVEDNCVKLGGNAMAAIALTKYTELTGDRPYIPMILELGKRLRSLQEESGEFIAHKQTYPEGEILDFISDIYPGEAIFALLCIYNLSKDREWLDAAHLGIRYLTEMQKTTKRKLAPDPWLLQSLTYLAREEKQGEYLDYAEEMAKAIVRSQNLKTSYLDWLGGIYQPPRSLATARRMRGLCAACELAFYTDNIEMANSMLEALKLGIAFQLQTQFCPESVFYLRDPQHLLGAFRNKLTDFETRIDCIQHNILSLLGFYRLLRDRTI